jgi:hypothetical protein
MKVRNTDTGIEWELNADAWTHGVASYRIGLMPGANPYSDEQRDKWLSWAGGYETARAIRAKTSED